MAKLSVLEFAKKRMMEEASAGNEDTVLYWAAYIEGANAQLREDRASWQTATGTLALMGVSGWRGSDDEE